MICLVNRKVVAQAVEQAHVSGVRLKPACELAGIDASALQLWKVADGVVWGGGGPDLVRSTPAQALSEAERRRLLQAANEPHFSDVPHARIVLMLADEGMYLAAESSFHRVLRVAGQSGHLGRVKASQAVSPPIRLAAALGHDQI